MENTKRCSKCGRELPLSEFYKRKSSKDGLQAYCKDCKKQHGKQWRADNSDYFKQWYAEHRDERLEKMKQWYADNADERKQYNKQYYAEHAECKKYYYQVHREEILEFQKQYNSERYATIEGYAYAVRQNNLQNDRKYGRCGMNEDPLPPLEYYVWGIQQRDFYDGKQYHWSEMGFDRIDNSKPHTIDNIVPCSTANNRRRGRKSFEEFCELMRKEEEELNLILN